MVPYLPLLLVNRQYLWKKALTKKMYDVKYDVIQDNFIMSLHCHWINLADSNLINAKGSKEGTWISRHFCWCFMLQSIFHVDLFKINKETKRKNFINLKKGSKFRRKYNMSWKRESKLKGTLMQTWKSPYMFAFISKQYLENFTFLILRILELFACEACKFLKMETNFWHILLFLNVC